MSLATKYRPQSFDQVAEQSATKVILEQQLKSGDIKNAYLFCGSAGTGKTTCARIFANELNQHKGIPIELDAASNNSVDDVREIIQQSKTTSLDSEYKVFIIDECFSANTLIDTEYGQVPIDKICVGDYVKSMTGNQKVTHIFKNSVLTDRLCCVTINSKKIITTVDHLFFTEIGWVEARNLKKGLIVYGNEDLQELWKRVCKETGQGREILLSQLLSRVSEEKSCSKNKGSEVSDLWQKYDSSELLKQENLFSGMYEAEYIFVQYTNCEYRIWDGLTETVIRKNEEVESDGKQSCYSENAGYEREEWHSSQMVFVPGWEREVYNSTDSLVASIRRWMGIGVSNSDKLSKRRASVSYVLQSRPWFFDEETCDRSRWSRPSLEKWTIKGCKENEVSDRLRVDSVEIYERGNNDELFRGSFTDTELSGKTVTMYDLEVDNDHSYFANGVLVHNCHALSNQAWQAMLKVLEEPPKKSIFILCTTDPQRIPKTILSRVQRFDFQRLSTRAIEDRLAYVVSEENVGGDTEEQANKSEEAIKYIAKQAQGGMRDALTMLDKCLAYSEDLTIENVTKALGIADYDILLDLFRACLTYDSEERLRVIDEVYMSGKDLKQFLKSFTGFILDFNKWLLGAKEYLDCPLTDEITSAFLEFENFECAEVLLGTLIKLQAEIKWDTNPRARLEAWCITGE